MNLLDDQLRDHNAGLTVAVFCFLLLATVTMWILPSFFSLWDAKNIEEGYYPESMSLITGENPHIAQWSLDLWQFIDELLVVLFIWWILNTVQMACLAIDQVRGRS